MRNFHGSWFDFALEFPQGVSHKFAELPVWIFLEQPISIQIRVAVSTPKLPRKTSFQRLWLGGWIFKLDVFTQQFGTKLIFMQQAKQDKRLPNSLSYLPRYLAPLPTILANGSAIDSITQNNELKVAYDYVMILRNNTFEHTVYYFKEIDYLKHTTRQKI